MFIDSHCHLGSTRYAAEEISSLLENAQAAGVHRMITLATSLDDLHANLTLANHPAVHTCIGIHPCDVHYAPDDAVTQLGLHVDDSRVCGIGETGLDYFHPAPDGWVEGEFRQRQRQFLREHFTLAARAKLNVVIHTRDLEGTHSFEDALAIYGEFSHSLRAVFHCFIGTWENAKRVLDLGGLVSIGGVVTFKNANEVRETARCCPAGSFMIETDSPYLAPQPHRGRRNEPAYIHDTAVCLANLRGETLEELALHTTECANSFFRLRGKSC